MIEHMWNYVVLTNNVFFFATYLYVSCSIFVMSSVCVYNIESAKDKEKNIASDRVTFDWECKYTCYAARCQCKN